MGIDVSKSHLDICLYSESQPTFFRVKNADQGFQQILELLGEKQQVLVCLEHTGIYTFPVCSFLSENKIAYTLIAAAQIKKSMGIQRGKNDKADARTIARYGFLFQNELSVTILPEKLIMKLKLLFGHRERLVKAKKVVAVPVKEMNQFISKDLYSPIHRSTEQVINKIQKQIDSIDKQMIDLISAAPKLKDCFELCQSVPGIGPQIAIYLIITTRGFKAFKNARQFACYSGIAPFEYSSGKTIRGKSKVNHLANKKAKALLSMGALNAIRHDRELKAYFERKVKQGKNKMAVLNAVRNKLIARVFATVNRATPYIQVAKY